MKKLVLLLIAFCTLGSLTVSAQTKPADSTKTRKSRSKKATTPATTAPATTTPAPAPAPAPATTAKTTPAKPVVNPPNKSADKAVGTDAKGRTIYEGPRGGRYVLTASGNKEYLKKTN
jgi:colicin import membrane protein